MWEWSFGHCIDSYGTLSFQLLNWLAQFNTWWTYIATLSFWVLDISTRGCFHLIGILNYVVINDLTWGDGWLIILPYRTMKMTINFEWHRCARNSYCCLLVEWVRSRHDAWPEIRVGKVLFISKAAERIEREMEDFYLAATKCTPCLPTTFTFANSWKLAQSQLAPFAYTCFG